MGVININTIRLFAHHGCLEEEGVVGSAYEVDLKVEANLSTAAGTDQLSDTVDYVLLHHIVREEMGKRSKLLEHVSNRIILRVLHEIPLVDGIVVTVAKINPPIGGDVDRVSVTLEGRRP